MNEKIVVKPVVSFGSVLGFSDYKGYGVCALLSEVRNHPHLGDIPEVRTSRVEQLVYDDDGRIKEVITKNTHYVRREE